MALLTEHSVDALLWKIAEKIYDTARRSRRDRWWWRPEDHPPPLSSEEPCDVGQYLVADEYAPGLGARVRLWWMPQRHRPERPEVYMLVDLRQTPVVTEEEWRAVLMSSIPPSDHPLRPLKEATVRVRLGGLPQRRRDAPWFKKGWPEPWGQQPMKQAEQDRLSGCTPFTPETLMDLLRREGFEAADIEWFEQEPADVPMAVRERWGRGDPPIWRTIWIDPRKQTVEDIRFQLALVLLQEQMISEETTRHELELWTVGYLRRHWPRLDDAVAYEVLDKLRRTFVWPEDWRAFLAYAKPVVRGVRAKASANARPEGERYQPGSLRDRAAQLGVSPSTLSRWRTTGRVTDLQTEEGIVAAQAIIEERHAWQALYDYRRTLGEQKGLKNPEAAARRWVSRVRKAGEHPKVLVHAMLGQPGEAKEPEE